MRHVGRSSASVIIMVVLLLAVANNSAAQSCLGIEACLLSPARSDAGLPTSPNGCSVPPQFGALGQFWANVFVNACNQHDTDWSTFKSDVAGWYVQSNLAFRNNLRATCAARTDLDQSTCLQAAEIFFLAVSTTDIAADIYRNGQYFASSCACRQPPAPPSGLIAQVSSAAGGGVVNLQWTPGTAATSYQVEVVQPLVTAINTNNPQPLFTASGVPLGQYRVQVRSVNPLGLSAPSNAVDVIVGSGTPCAIPAAPSPTASLVAGVGSVTWSPIPGATSYVVVAGTQPGGSDLFNANVGNVTSVAAAGLPPGFRAFVRVYAVSACGPSGPSAEVILN